MLRISERMKSSVFSRGIINCLLPGKVNKNFLEVLAKVSEGIRVKLLIADTPYAVCRVKV